MLTLKNLLDDPNNEVFFDLEFDYSSENLSDSQKREIKFLRGKLVYLLLEKGGAMHYYNQQSVIDSILARLHNFCTGSVDYLEKYREEYQSQLKNGQNPTAEDLLNFIVRKVRSSIIMTYKSVVSSRDYNTVSLYDEQYQSEINRLMS